jgi:hypothetical protein
MFLAKFLEDFCVAMSPVNKVHLVGTFNTAHAHFHRQLTPKNFHRQISIRRLCIDPRPTKDRRNRASGQPAFLQNAVPLFSSQATRMEKGSGAAAGGSARPPPMPQFDELSFEGKKPVKNPFVPIGTSRAPSL